MTHATSALQLLTGEAVEEVPLDPSPLARVVCQARIERLGVFHGPNPVSPLLGALLDEYPLFDEGFEKEILLSFTGVTEKDSTSPVWRFRTMDRNWLLTVTPTSIALETAKYDSRSDFVSRFERVCQSFVDNVGRSIVTRLGIRYTNLVPQSAQSNPIEFLDPRIRGPLNIAPDLAGVRHALNDLAVAEGNRFLQSKWGILPPGAIFDPTLPPVAEATGLLDIDSYVEEPMELDPEKLQIELRGLAEAAYRLFRVAVDQSYIDRNKAHQ